MTKSIIAPSILAANLGNLRADLETIETSSADWIHIDVMDGSFVSPITFGDNIVKICKGFSKKFLDVHLMINNPAKHISTFIQAGSDGITFHLEAEKESSALLKKIKSAKIKAGLAIKPDTKWEDFKDLIADCDLLLLMTVEPGFGGQAFRPEILAKIQLASQFIKNNKLSTKIEVDGGINNLTGKQCWDAGAEVLVAGSYIFNSQDPRSAIESLKYTHR